MAFLEISNVAVKGISACVPSHIVENEAIYAKWGGYENFLHSTGIARHRNSTDDQCSSDLCLAAAEKLISELKWEKSEIEALVFVTQTPDYNYVPATSPILQHKLGLTQNCFTLDIALGCSGWVYAFSVLASLMQTGTIKKGLLLAGDSPSKLCSIDDKSTYPLFGDAGTVTALEYEESTKDSLKFLMHTDGSGYDAIIVEDGGMRNRVTSNSFIQNECGEGIIRSKLNVELDGMSVFSFGISKAPRVVKDLCENYCIDMDSIDLFTFHQANMLMNEKIRKKLKIQEDKVPYSIHDFGNTSCASIPLTLVTQCKDRLCNEKLNHIGCGFGVGLSWGAVHFCTDNIVVPDLIEI